MRKRSSIIIDGLLIICLILTMFSPDSVKAVSPSALSEGSGYQCGARNADTDGVLTSDEIGFKDVQDPKVFYYNSVYWAVDEGITLGTTKDTFTPGGFCTRGQIVTFIWRMSGEAIADKPASFSDVSEDAFYSNAVAWAVQQGITSGTTPTTFSPSDPCTRAQIVTFLWRMDGMSAASTVIPFSDVKEKDYFAEAVAWAVEKGITSGTTKTTFSPKDTCTRAQAVTFIQRYYQSVTNGFNVETLEEDKTATFSCSPDYIQADTKTKVRFYASGISGDEIQAVSDDGTITVILNDRGLDGDAEAGDGVYTGTKQVSMAEADSREYSLIIDGVRRAKLSITTYTSEDLSLSNDTVDIISERTGELTAAYQRIDNDIGENIDIEEREVELKEIGENLSQFLDELKTEGKVLSWEETDGVFYINLLLGTCVIPLQSIIYQDDVWGSVEVSGQKSTFTEAELFADDDSRSLIASIEPFYLEGITKWHDESAKLIQDNVSGFKFSTTIDHDFHSDYYTMDGQAVLPAEAMNFYRDQLDDYNVIIWNGHGVYTNDAGAFLYSGIYHSKLIDELYANDIAAGRLYWSVIGYGKEDVVYGLTGGFFQYHYKMKGHKLNDSLVYLGACHGGQYGGVCQSFIACGAKAAVGFDEAINQEYEAAFVEDFFKTLVKKEILTGMSREVTSAFNAAVFRNKGFETLLHAAGQPAKAVLYKASGPDYRLTDYAYHKPNHTGPETEEPDQEPSVGTITDSWEEIIEAINDGTYKEKYNIGDTKGIDLGAEGIIEMQIAAFDADELADGTGRAAITWISKGMLNSFQIMNYNLEQDPSGLSDYQMGTGSTGGWEYSLMRSWLNSDIKPLIPSTVRNAIKPVKKYSNSRDDCGNNILNAVTIDEIWIPSYGEVFNEADVSRSGRNYETAGPIYSELFPSDRSRKKLPSGGSDSWKWWLRTSNHSSGEWGNNAFLYVSSDSIIAQARTETKNGVVIGFCT